MSRTRSQPNKVRSAASALRDLLERCEPLPRPADTEDCAVALTGRIHRSSRKGHFVLVRADGTGGDRPALELATALVLELEHLFTDSAGRSTHRVLVSQGSRARLVAGGPGRDADSHARPPADLGDAAIDPRRGLEAWESAPWRAARRAEPPQAAPDLAVGGAFALTGWPALPGSQPYAAAAGAASGQYSQEASYLSPAGTQPTYGYPEPRRSAPGTYSQPRDPYGFPAPPGYPAAQAPPTGTQQPVHSAQPPPHHPYAAQHPQFPGSHYAGYPSADPASTGAAATGRANFGGLPDGTFPDPYGRGRGQR